MPVYEKPKPEVIKMVNEICEKHHGELHENDVTVEVLMAHAKTNENGESNGPPLKKSGYPCAAIVKVNSLEMRVLGHADARITIDGDRWPKLKPDVQRALIDHELEHLMVKKDKDGAVVFDDIERPRLRIRAHDHEVGWFSSVVRRHGRASIEWQSVDAISQSCRQMELPFLQEIG